MKVILLEKVDNLGTVGDQVNVKNGFARNFLLPKQKAIRATPDQISYFESQRSVLEAKAADLVNQAKAKAEKLEGLTINISALASDEGKLFGSISPLDIANKITELGTEVAKKEIDMPNGPIHAIGESNVNVHLHGDVSVPVTIVVTAEKSH